MNELQQRLFNALGSQVDAPWREFANGLSGGVETPYIGSHYRAGGLLFLQGEQVMDAPQTIVERGRQALAQVARAPLDFLYIAALAGVFLSRYSVDAQVRETATSLLESTGGAEQDAAALQQCVDQIAFGRLTQALRGDWSERERSEFHQRWLETALKIQLETLAPFYIFLTGDGKAAWELVANALGAVAWRRENARTPIGHVIALRERELIAEIMYVKRAPQTPAELDKIIRDFREFIEGGFLLGSDEFSFVTRA